MLNIKEGWRLNNTKKSEFSDEKGCKKEDVGGTGEEEKRTERERERLNSPGK